MSDGDDLALWAHRRLAAKNNLIADDARVVEVAYKAVLDATGRDVQGWPEAGGPSPELGSPENAAAFVDGSAAVCQQPATAETVLPIRKEVRRRNKAHLAFVGSQPCLVCQRSPCDAHHLKFAQPRSLRRKVSDEFTVPLCRNHHLDLHRYGNEIAWWANLKIAPTEVARDLWQTTLLDPDMSITRKTSLRPPKRRKKHDQIGAFVLDQRRWSPLNHIEI
ncbi:MAG: hypothetical protein WA840_17660 [Caulobacteraceae bacterium]